MLVCRVTRMTGSDLAGNLRPEPWELRGSQFGEPYWLSPGGRRFAVVTHLDEARYILGQIESWQSWPENDVLRARGDPRWQIASKVAAQYKHTIATHEPDIAPYTGEPPHNDYYEPSADSEAYKDEKRRAEGE